MRVYSVLFLGLGLSSVLGTAAVAVPILPTAIEILVPADGNNPGTTGIVTPSSSTTYTDDIFLESLTFGAAGGFTSSSNFRAAIDLEVTANRENVNVEWGDTDDNADLDPNPMTSIGQPDTAKESTDPAIQDAGLLQVFNSLSLTEMTDGESGGHAFKVAFANSIVDNDNGVDGLPEIVIFERGRNDVFDVELIIGGDFDTPVLSSALRIDSGDFADLGLRVDTTEISGSQALGVAGFDLNDWGLSSGEDVFGFVLTRVSGGPDIGGFFAAGESVQFSDPISGAGEVPLPASIWLMLAGLGCLAGMRRRA